MTTVGSVDIRVRLARDQLARDIAELRSLLASIDRLDIDTDGARGGLDRTNDSASSLKATIGGLAATAGIALSIVTEKATQAAIAFDAAKAKASTLSSDASGLSVSMRQLADDLKGQANATDLLNSSYDVLSSGYAKTADVTNILKNSTYAAVGGFSNVNTVADATTTILNSYGKSAEDAAQVTDVLIATQNAGKITVAQYAGLIGQAATTAAAAGVSLEEFSAFVAGATAKGVQASSAVTGIRAAITSILSPTLVASRLAKDLGVQFDAAALQSKGLSGILAELNAKGAATPSVLVELFGSVEAVAAIMPSAGANVATFNKNLAYIQNSAGLAKEAADKVSDSFEGRMQRSANLASEAFLSLGQGVITVVSPVMSATQAILEGFNSLPEPIKNTIGVAIGLTGAVLTLGGAYATITALTPIMSAGIAGVSAALGINTAITGASATVATAAGVAKGFLTAQINATSLALAATTVHSYATVAAFKIQAIATGTAATATLGLIKNLAILAAQAALVAGAIYVVSQLFKRSEGAQFASQVDANTQKMREFSASLKDGSKTLEEATAKANGAASGFDLMGQTFAKSGAIEALRVGLAELDRALGGTSKTTSDYGEKWGIITAEQRGAQLSMFALESQIKETGVAMDATTALLAKYGLTTVEAGDKQRLGADGIQKFKNEVADQIKVLDNYIDTLKSQKAPTQQQQQLIDNEIKLLEKQKQILRGRIVAVESDTQGNKDNSQSLKQVIVDIKDLSAAYEKGNKDINLATAKNKADIAEQLQQGVITAEQAQLKNLQVEAKGLEERKKLIDEAIPKIEVAKIGAKPEEVEKANNKIQELESESANIRSQVAQNLLNQKKAANAEALKNEEDTVKKSARNLIDAEVEKTIAVRKLQQQGNLTDGEAVGKIAQIKLESNAKEIASEEEKITRLKSLRERNAITAKEYADAEAQISTNIKQLKLKNLQDEIKATEEARANELKKLEKDNAKKLALSNLKTGRATLGVRQQEASGAIDSEQSNKKILEIEKQATKERLSLANSEYIQIDDLEKRKVITKKEASDRRLELDQKVTDLSLQLASKEIEARNQANDRILTNLARRNSLEERAISLSAITRTTAIEDAVFKGLKTQELAAVELAQIQQEITQSELAQIEERRRQINELENAKIITAKQAQEEREDLDDEYQRKQVDLAKGQIALAKAVRDEFIQSIQDRVDAAKRASDEEIALLEKQKSQLQDLISLREQDNRLLQSRANLAKAVNGTQQARASAGITRLDSALQARQKLDSEDVDPQTRQVLENVISRSGASGLSSSQILGDKLAQEALLAQKVEEARQRELQVARAQLEIEIQRNKLTAEVALLEAQITDAKASQSQLQAQANLEKAIATGDKRAIALAGAEVKTADLSKELAAKQISIAERGLKIQDEVAINSQKALVAQEQASNFHFLAAEETRLAAAAMQLAQANAEDAAAGRATSGYNPLTDNRVSGAQIKEPNLTAQAMAQAYPTYEVANSPNATPTAEQILQNTGLADLMKLSQELNLKSQGNEISKTTQSDMLPQLKEANGEVVSQLQQMNSNLEAIASRPSNLTVTTANPVSDAAKIYADQSKQAVRNANL